MNTYFIEFLNHNGANTNISYSHYIKKYWVCSEAEILDGEWWHRIVEHEDTIEQAIEAFNKKFQGYLVRIKIKGTDSYREILIPKF
jgi:hypothetical protein